MTVYAVRDTHSGAIKFGFTGSPDPRPRVKTLQTASPHRLELLASAPGTRQSEAHLHHKHSRDRIRHDGEWFRPSEAVLYSVSVMKQDGERARARACSSAPVGLTGWVNAVNALGHDYGPNRSRPPARRPSVHRRSDTVIVWTVVLTLLVLFVAAAALSSA